MARIKQRVWIRCFTQRLAGDTLSTSCSGDSCVHPNLSDATSPSLVPFWVSLRQGSLGCQLLKGKDAFFTPSQPFLFMPDAEGVQCVRSLCCWAQLGGPPSCGPTRDQSLNSKQSLCHLWGRKVWSWPKPRPKRNNNIKLLGLWLESLVLAKVNLLTQQLLLFFVHQPLEIPLTTSGRHLFLDQVIPD